MQFVAVGVIYIRQDKGKKPFNLFPNKPLILHVRSKGILKTLWKKEKLLETSIFSFSRGVFYPFGEFPAMMFVDLKLSSEKAFC